MAGYIYLLNVYENNPELIYKLGKTKREFECRFQNYKQTKPKVICVNYCDDCDSAERNILSIFKKKFIERKDMGNEYFTGNIKQMQSVFWRYFISEDLFMFPESNKIITVVEPELPIFPKKISRTVSNFIPNIERKTISRSVSTNCFSNKSKLPMSPFKWFYKKKRDEEKEKNPNFTYKKIELLLREQWDSMNLQDRKIYEEFAKNDRIRYKNDNGSLVTIIE